MAAVAESANGTEDRQFAPPSAAPDRNSEFRRDVRKLVDLLSKLNPSAKEFVPSSHATAAAAPPPALATLPGPAVAGDRISNGVLSADAPVFVVAASDQSDGYKDSSSEGSLKNFRRKSNYTHGGRKRINQRVLKAQREESIRRTVYVSDIDQQITEQQLATLFASCSQVVDCRICGDPHSVLRFAFVEFVDEEGARAALNLSGTVLGFYPVRVLPSKTAILPVNPTFLPRSEDEREMCTRTIYCTNIDKKTTQQEVRVFFESICGKVSCLRLLGDRVHSTHIAFVEFAQAESAILALSCSGMVLGELPIRVSPSKTPVRPWIPCATMH